MKEPTERCTDVERILLDFKEGRIDLATAQKELDLFSIDHISGIATIDSCRQNRKGVPEVVYADTKEPGDAASIAIRLVEKNGFAFLTRASIEHHSAVEKRVGELQEQKEKGLSTTISEVIITYNEKARTILLHQVGFRFPDTGGKVGVLTAGTSDIPVAEEAVETCRIMGCETVSFYDVGIAGMHRLFDPLKRMVEDDVDVIIVIAGMEGALPSVVSSLVDVPVIGVPTSIGYGFGGKGKAALMSMLQSCSPGLMTVNIDNGFGAGVGACLIARRSSKGCDRISLGNYSNSSSDEDHPSDKTGTDHENHGR